MLQLKSIFIFFILLFAVSSYSADSFEFDPQNHTAKLESNYIGFIENSTNEKIGPELYADETDSDFFALVKNIITNAETDNTKTILLYENKDSGTHGSYNQIIPDS